MKKFILTIIIAMLCSAAYGQILHEEANVNPGSTATMPDIPYSDIYSLLQTIPGVEVIGGAVSIRGSDPFEGENPLILYDGVEVFDLDEINPYDVHSVDVLKGPEAAIYGERGKYGVISIKSKGEQFMRESAKEEQMAAEADEKAQRAEVAAVKARGIARAKARAAEAARAIAEKAKDAAEVISQKAEELKISVFGSPEEKQAQKEAKQALKAAKDAQMEADRASAEAEMAEEKAKAAEDDAARAASAAEDAAAARSSEKGNGKVSVTYSTGTRVR